MMKFPKSLLQKSKKKLPDNKLHKKTYVFARFPPSQWSEDDEYPDFNQIKLDQSFNWSAYSISLWVRFTPQKEYKLNNGICGFSIGKINSFTFDNEKNIYSITHKPLQTNYSHCELCVNKDIGKRKSFKRQFRMEYKHYLELIVKPNKNISLLKKIGSYILMYYHRLLAKTTHNKV